jgi:GntR family transcriptional regulator, transcriptional repressor for pyruvate dehydrogenase complex
MVDEPKASVTVAGRIVRDISRAGLAAGDRLPAEREMLAEYGVGRGTLREALRFLELQGVITLRRGAGGGPVVRAPDAHGVQTALALLLQFQDAPYSTVTEVRSVVEPLLARWAAERADDAGLARIGASVEAMEASLSDTRAFLRANEAFHDGIAHASGNPVLGALVDAIGGLLDGTVQGVEYPERRRRDVLAAHRRIQDALLRRDGTAAEEAMRDHIAEYEAYLRRRYPDALRRSIVWDERA